MSELLAATNAEIIVIGSASIDLVTYSSSLPLPGETIKGTSFEKHYGGKGANQAVQAAQLGLNVAMCGRVGNDAWGSEYINNLKSFGINVDAFHRGNGQTGIASIFVAESGANSIVIVAGANDEIIPSDIDLLESNIRSSKIVVCQNEIPVESTTRALELARKHNVTSILNPAPASPALLPVIGLCDIVCPNETELAVTTGMPAGSIEEIVAAAQHLLSQAQCKIVIATVGERGAVIVPRDGEPQHIPTQAVKAVDTVGAGDSFIGTLAANLARKSPLSDAVNRALGCATLSVQVRGAQESYRHISTLDASLHPPALS